jgi:hypothetical protein
VPLRLRKASRQINCPVIAKTDVHQGYFEVHKGKAGWHLNERTKGNKQIFWIEDKQ